MSAPNKFDGWKADAPVASPVEPADYSDELTEAQIKALRAWAPQDESQLGALVHEFTW